MSGRIFLASLLVVACFVVFAKGQPDAKPAPPGPFQCPQPYPNPAAMFGVVIKPNKPCDANFQQKCANTPGPYTGTMPSCCYVDASKQSGCCERQCKDCSTAISWSKCHGCNSGNPPCQKGYHCEDNGQGLCFCCKGK